MEGFLLVPNSRILFKLSRLKTLHSSETVTNQGTFYVPAEGSQRFIFAKNKPNIPHPPTPTPKRKGKTQHVPQNIFVMFFALLFPPLKWDPGLLQKLICVERSGKKWEPFCKNTSKTAFLADANSCKMFRCYLQGTSLYFCSYTGAGKGSAEKIQ